MSHWFTYPTNIDPIALHLGPINIHWYGIAYLAGFVCVYLWMNRPAGRKRLGLTSEQIQDFLFYALIGVLVGGRTFFVFNDIISKHDLSLYVSNPINIIAVWNGGMAFHGGMVGVIVGILLFIRKHPGLTYTILGDEVVMLLPIGIFLTRIVNFINDELWGDICRPDRPWCLQFPTAPDPLAYRHPAQIYEAILDILTLPILLYLYKRKPNDGVVAWSWFTIYGVTRSVAELWRHADFRWMGITGGQLYALPMIVIGLIMVFYYSRHGQHTDERPVVTK
ncbi:MAG TPA: prolipoprotein diacylglyceryl transferase [Candidatus Dormibacteraeota bacterium]|nr:prolipoprotein diacylglyceryl transferase [Candidatus Dormibacteraeota bacterium]